MHDLLSPQEIEARAAEAGRTMTEVCRTAGVAPSTFTRWKAGQTEPTLGVYRKLVSAVAPKAEAAA
jgi:predicted transcriptional regulator